MALSALVPQGLFQRVSFSAAAAGGVAPLVTESTELTCLNAGKPDAVTGSHEEPTEFITVFCQMSTAAASGTLAFFLADDDSVTDGGDGLGDGKLFQDVATITAGTLRQSHNTAGGNYVASVVFAISGRNTLDVRPVTSTKERPWPKWYVALTAISAGTAVIWVCPGRAL